MEEDKGGGKERADQVAPVEEVVVKCVVVVGSIGCPPTDRSTDQRWRKREEGIVVLAKRCGVGQGGRKKTNNAGGGKGRRKT